MSEWTFCYSARNRQGYPLWIETNPWNLIRFIPAEGART